MELMLTMDPLPASIMSGATARVTKNTPFRFTLITASQSASAHLVDHRIPRDAGVVDKDVDCARLRLDALDHGVHRRGVRHVHDHPRDRRVPFSKRGEARSR